MNIKDIINRERCTILPRNQHARSILVAHNAALDRIEAIILSMYLVETCDWCGKKFVKLPDHPHKDGSARCPHCMADGVDVRQQRIAESPPVAGSETEPEPDFTGRVAELEAALKLAMDWLEDDVPKHIVDKLINSLR